jgi:hypothetical protein
LHRKKTNETCYLTAPLRGQYVLSEQVSYIYQADWIITQRLGEWSITVASCELDNHPLTCLTSQSYVFRINKREQIVTLARYWSRRNLAICNQLPTFNGCDGFAGYIYSHLGLPAPYLAGPGAAAIIDNGPGAVRYFFDHRSDSSVSGAAHLAIVSGPHQMIDNNWGSSGRGPQEHNNMDGIETYYSPAPVNCAPKDPASSGQSLLDSL